MIKNLKKFTFMAIAKGKKSVEGSSVKRYIGIAPVSIETVNPDKATLEKLYNTTLENDIQYLTEVEVGPEGKKHKVPQIRIDFIVKTDASKCGGIDMTTKISFFVSKEIQYNRDCTKAKVINKYGETAWLPLDNIKEKTVPDSMKWFEIADYRPAFIGEEELTNFLKIFLRIPNKNYRNKAGEIVELENKSDAEIRFDHVIDFFKGDIKEIKEAIAFQPDNRIKVLFGVKNSDDNKQYQTVYTQKFLSAGSTNYSKLEEDLKDRKAAGAYPNTEFAICNLKEYTVTPTNFESAPSDLPFCEPDSPWAF